VFIARGKEDALVTRNLVPGDAVYGEKRISIDVSTVFAVTIMQCVGFYFYVLSLYEAHCVCVCLRTHEYTCTCAHACVYITLCVSSLCLVDFQRVKSI